METVSIQGRKYKFFRPLRGGNGNKFNRALKLAIMFDELDDKLKGFYQNGNGLSLHAICSLAVRLLMHTGIRVGNEGSAEGYMTKPHPYSKAKPEFVKTYGLTTLKLGAKGSVAFSKVTGFDWIDPRFTSKLPESRIYVND